MGYVLGIDLGTSSMKGILLNQEGKVIKKSTENYPLIQPKSGYNEQNPKEWIKACETILNDLSHEIEDFTEKLEAVSFSGQMHSLVLLDANKEVLRPAILWNDVRNTEQCEQIMNDFGGTLLDVTHNIALEGFTLPKILWVQQNETDIWNRVKHILLPKDYLRAWLTGKLNMDYSDAAGTLLLDLKTHTWSRTISERYDIPLEYLPPLIESTGYVGTITEAIKDTYGFVNDILVFAGGADNACAAVGAGITNDSVGMASIGTSGVFLSVENEIHNKYKGKLHFFSHSVPNTHYSMGVTLAAGNSLSWFKETFAPDKSFDSLLENIGEITPGSDGLMFTPYISGERTPHIDSKVRGSFVGIDARHKLSHFARAVLEGITFSLKESQGLMLDVANKDFERIISVGGGAKNNDWLQIQADIFDAEIVTLEAEEGPGYGAAIIAAVGAGWYDSIEECTDEFVQYGISVKPNAENVMKYQKQFDIYKQVYGATKDITYQVKEI